MQDASQAQEFNQPATQTAPAAQAGVISLASAHDVASTEARLLAALESKGMRIFAQVDHSAGAAGVGLELRPTRLVIFGNPKAGTPLMQCGQTMGLDLPQKALIWQDAENRVWLSYNDPHYLAERHQLKNCQAAVEKVSQALANFARAATQADASEQDGSTQQEIYY